MLRAFLIQLVDQDDSLIEHIYQKCSSATSSELRTISTLKQLAEEILKSQQRWLIVLDGLDECGDGQNMKRESEGIIEWFKHSVIPSSHSQGGSVRLLLAGQRDGVLDQHLSGYPNIKLDTIDAHLRDIRNYAKSRAADIQRRFSLSQDSKAEIINKVTAASKGEHHLIPHALHISESQPYSLSHRDVSLCQGGTGESY